MWALFLYLCAYIYILKLVGHHLTHYSFAPCMRLSRYSSCGPAGAPALLKWAGMWEQRCRRSTSLLKPGLQGIKGELCLTHSPPSRSCHAGRGVLLLSLTPIGCRSGASVRSLHRILQLLPSMLSSHTLYDSEHTWDVTTHARATKGRRKAFSVRTVLSDHVSLLLSLFEAFITRFSILILSYLTANILHASSNPKLHNISM